MTALKRTETIERTIVTDYGDECYETIRMVSIRELPPEPERAFFTLRQPSLGQRLVRMMRRLRRKLGFGAYR